MTPHPAPPCRILLAGASGTIGRAVLRQLEAEGHTVHALTRAALTDVRALKQAMTEVLPDVVISCIASRSGAPKVAEAIEYAANAALLAAAQAAGAQQFILLSAICVQKPRLAFQHAGVAMIEMTLKSPPRVNSSGAILPPVFTRLSVPVPGTACMRWTGRRRSTCCVSRRMCWAAVSSRR